MKAVIGRWSGVLSMVLSPSAFAIDCFLSIEPVNFELVLHDVEKGLSQGLMSTGQFYPCESGGECDGEKKWAPFSVRLLSEDDQGVAHYAIRELSSRTDRGAPYERTEIMESFVKGGSFVTYGDFYPAARWVMGNESAEIPMSCWGG